MPKRSLSNSVPSFSATSSELPVHLYSSITSSLEPTSNLLLKTQDNNSLIGVRDGNNGSTADSSCCRSQMTSTNPCGDNFITNDIEGCKNGEVIRTSETSVGDGNVDCSIFSRDANHAYRGVSKSRSKQPKETVKEHWNLAETNPNEFVRLLSARLEKLKESRHKMESLLSRVSQEAKLPPSDTRSGNTLSTDPSWSMEPGRMPLRYRAGHYDRSCEPKLLQPPRAMTVEDHCAKHIGKYERRGRRRGAGENELYRTRQAPSSAYASLSPASSSRFATSRSSCCDSLTTSTFPSSTPPFGTNVLDIPAIPSNPVSTGSIPISPFPKSHLNWCPSRCCRSHPRTLRPRNHHRHRHNRPSARSSGPPSHGHSMSASAVTPGTVAIEDGCSCKCDLSGESCLLQREDCLLPDPLDEDAQSILESHCSRIWAAEKKKINEGDEKGDDEEEKKRNDRKEENNSKFFKRSPVAPIQKLPHMQALTHLTTPTPQLFSLNRQNVPPSDPAHLSYSNQNQTDVPHQSARISNSIRHRVFTTEDQQGLTTMQYVPEMIASSPCVGKMMPNLVTTSAVADELRPHTKRMPLDSLIHPPPLSTTCAGACTTEASQCFLPAAVKECTRGPDGNFQPDFCNFTIRSTDSNMAVTSASCMTTSATASTHSEQLTTYYRHQVPHLSNITFKQTCCDRSACKSTQSYLPSRQNSVICQNSNCYRGLQSPCSSSTPFDYRVETYRIRGQCNRPRLSVSGPSLSEARSLTSIDSGVVTNLHSGSNSTHPHVSQANRLTSVYLETTDIQSRPTASDAFRLAHSGITSPDQASIEEEYTEKQTELAAVDEVEQSLEREGDLCDLDLSHPMIASSLASTSLQALTSSHLDLTSALAIEDTCTARLVNSLMSQQRHRSRSAAKHRYRTGSSKLGLPVISPLLLVGPTNRLSNEVTNDPETCCPMCCSLCSPSVPANDFAMDSLLPPPPYNTVTGRDSGHGIPFASNPTPKATSEPHHQLAPSLAVRFEASSHSPASKARRLPTISQSTQAKQVVYAITSGLIGRSRSLASEDTSSIVDSGVSSAYDQLPAAQTGQVAVLENTSRALTSLLRPMLAYNTTSNSSAIIQPTNPDNPQGALDRSPNTLVDNFLSLCLAEDTDKGHQPPFSRQTLDSSDARGALPSSSPRPVVRMVWPNAIKKPTQGNTSSESMLTISGAHLPVSEPPELSERVNWPHESNCKMCAKFHGEECTQACPVNNGFHIPPTLTITNIPTTSITAASSGLQGRNVVSGVKSMPSFTSPTSRKIKSFRRPMCSANRVSAIGDPGFVEPCVATSDFRSGNLLRIWLERQQQHQQKKNYHHHSHHPLLSPPPPPPSPPQPPRSPHFSPSLFLPTNHNNHSPHRHGQRRTGDSEPSIEWNELPTRVLEQTLIPNRSAHMRPELIAHETLVTPAVCGRPPNTHSGHIRGFQFVEFPQVACSPVPPHQPSYHEIPQDANPGHRSHHHHYHDHHLHYWHHRQYHRGKFAGALQSGPTSQRLPFHSACQKTHISDNSHSCSLIDTSVAHQPISMLGTAESKEAMPPSSFANCSNDNLNGIITTTTTTATKSVSQTQAEPNYLPISCLASPSTVLFSATGRHGRHHDGQTASGDAADMNDGSGGGGTFEAIGAGVSSMSTTDGNAHFPAGGNGVGVVVGYYLCDDPVPYRTIWMGPPATGATVSSSDTNSTSTSTTISTTSTSTSNLTPASQSSISATSGLSTHNPLESSLVSAAAHKHSTINSVAAFCGVSSLLHTANTCSSFSSLSTPSSFPSSINSSTSHFPISAYSRPNLSPCIPVSDTCSTPSEAGSEGKTKNSRFKASANQLEPEDLTGQSSSCDAAAPALLPPPQTCKDITLGQFKQLIAKKGSYRYFFKKPSDEFGTGVVHEEITQDDFVLPLWEGKIVARVEKAD